MSHLPPLQHHDGVEAAHEQSRQRTLHVGRGAAHQRNQLMSMVDERHHVALLGGGQVREQLPRHVDDRGVLLHAKTLRELQDALQGLH